MSYATQIRREVPELHMYSGNDDLIVPIMSIGGKGVISVVANILPEETHNICEYYEKGEVSKALDLQLEMLDVINNEINGETKVDFRAIYFDLNQDVLVSRIVNRRSCPICGEIYNLKFKPTKEEGKCDKCGGDLIRRKDDTEEIAKARFETYFEQTAPLIDYYKQRGVLYTLDAEGSIDEVWEKLLEIIND
jgi:adenylate kinase